MDSMLKRTRERIGMTLEHAARRLGISPGYLLQIEKGLRGVGGPRAEQIAELYGMDVEELFVPVRFTARFHRDYIKEGNYGAAGLDLGSRNHHADHFDRAGDSAQETV